MRAQEPQWLIKAFRACLVSLLLVRLIKKRVLTRVITSTSSGYCNGRVDSFDKVTKILIKSLLFLLLPNKLADPLWFETF